MIKFLITPERCAEVLNITEYLLSTSENKDVWLRASPRFAVGEDGKYIINVRFNEDGDIEEFEHLNDALMLMSGVTPKRLEKLHGEFLEAVKNIVNPQSGKASVKP